MKRGFVGSFVLLLMLIHTASFSQKPAVVTDNEPGWRKIGEITASFKKQNESIVVLGADEFTSIRLRVTEAPISLERLQVFYENGEMEDIHVSDELEAGAETRVFDLKNPYRDIQKVAFTYKTLPNYKGDKAEVELFGFKSKHQGESDAYRADREKAENDAEEAAEKTERNVEERSDEAGDQVAETAGNIGAGIKDKIYADKVAPGGQTIYIDKHAQYYYINDEGKKVFILKSQMKDKPVKD
jgi:hypothetical protein